MRTLDLRVLGRSSGASVPGAAQSSVRWGGAESLREVPFVPQMTTSDCVVAALMMVLRVHGRATSRAEARRAVGATRDGASALALMEGAARFGLSARGLRVPTARMNELGPGTVLHWENRHFVVFERTTRHGVWIVDPAIGRRLVSAEELGRAFSGLAIAFSVDPANAGRSSVTPRSPARELLREAMTPKLRLALMGTPLLLVALGAGSPLLMARFVARANLGSTSMTDLLELACLGTFAFVALVSLREASMARARRAMTRVLSTALRRGLIEAPVSFFQERTAIDLAGRLADVQALAASMVQSRTSLIGDGAAVLLYLALLAGWSPWITLTTLLVASAQLGLLGWAGGRVNRESTLTEEGERALRRFEARVLRSMSRFKESGPRSIERWSLLDAAANASHSDEALRKLAMVRDGFAAAAPLLIMGASAFEAARGALSIGTMVAANCVALSLLRPLTGVLASRQCIDLEPKLLDRIDDVLLAEATPAGARDSVDSPTLEPSSALAENAPLILLESVTVRYGANVGAALREIDLRIERGRTILIAGASGAGKSTLSSVIDGSVAPSEGVVRRSARRVVRLTESSGLFDGTLYENLSELAPELDFGAVVETARAVLVDEAIEALPMGYQTQVCDGGRGLPRGLVQRVAMARALSRDPEVLVLDGAIDGLDPTSELATLRALRAARPSLAIVIVSHSAAALASCDEVVTLASGRSRPVES